MANYFVDLSITSAGTSGTSAAPWGYLELQNNIIGPGIAATAYLKGQMTSGVFAPAGYGPFNLLSWDKSVDPVNGVDAPWIVRVTGSFDCGAAGVTEGGIIVLTQDMNSNPFNGTFYNCYVVGNYYIAVYPQTAAIFKGCSFNINTFLYAGVTRPFTFTDCVLVQSAVSATSASISLINSVSNQTLTGSWSATNSQFSWSAPTMPSWSASQSEFASSALAVGITVPPEPGTQPYTNYSKGLWRTQRYGIGAMDFSIPSFYVDLSLSATGNPGLYPWTPMGIDGLMLSANTLVGNVYIKGTGTYPQLMPPGTHFPTINNANLNWLCWDKSVNSYGEDAPWILNLSNAVGPAINFTFSNFGIIEGGIINSLTTGGSGGVKFIFANIKIYNTYANPHDGGFIIGNNSIIKGCIITRDGGGGLSASTNGQAAGTNIEIYDSLFPFGLDIFTNTSASAYNCAFNSIKLEDGTSQLTSANNQYNWIVPTMPSFSSTRSEFNSVNILSGVSVPPQSGNSPYTGYQLGLWRTARTNIGALDFTDTLTNLYSNINSSASTGNGTSANPYNATQTFDFASNGYTVSGHILKSNDTIRLAGYSNDTDILTSLGKTSTVTSYENGNPWSLSATTAILIVPEISANGINVTIKNGIISDLWLTLNGASVEALSGVTTLKNCIIYEETLINSLDNSMAVVFDGCTFVSANALLGQYYNYGTNTHSATFNDCVFIDSLIDDNNAQFGTISVNNCVFTYSQNTISANVSANVGLASTNSFVDCQYNWVPTETFPSFESVNTTTNDFNNFNLSSTSASRSSFWIANDYDIGFDNLNRVGPGAFYFLTSSAPISSIYYVDLNLSPSVSGTGSSIDPLSYSNFKAKVTSLTIPTNFYFKGSATDNDILNFGMQGANIYIHAWDTTVDPISGVDEPWRVRDTNNTDIKCQMIEGGIIYGNTTSFLTYFEPNSASDCYVIYDGSAEISLYSNSKIKGCTFITNNGFDSPYAVVTDSVLVGVSAVSGIASNTFTNCVFSFTDPGWNDTNSQWGWSNPTMPSWSADQSSFDSRVLSVGINTPPQSGNLPYTDYETGLWRESRLGIGAMYFVSGTLPLGHIGAFYFGPIVTNVSADTMIYTVTLLQPTISAATDVSAIVNIDPPLRIKYSLLPPSVLATYDILVNFVGVPRLGVSPLTVDFEGIVTFGGDYQDKYYVTEYKWYFDWNNNPTVYETSTSPFITHIYTGYCGQTFCVKLEVTIGVKP